jgi:hypothetical protein
VGESIITRADVEQNVRASDLSDSEAKLVRETYATTAELNGLDTLRAYEARGQRLETIADRFPEADAKVLKEQAQQIFAEVGATQARAAAFVLRRRSNTASFGIGTGILLFFFVVGWYCVAISADALQSRRADDITVAKNCAEARKEEKIVESELPKICGDPPKETVKKQTTAVEASDQAIESLAKARTTCHIAAAKAGAGEDACAPIDRGLAAAIEAGG